jgi:hypothetical protein
MTTFTITSENGSIIWDSPDSLRTYLLCNPGRLIATIGPPRKDKSYDQLKKFNAMCTELGDFLGYTKEEMKAVIKRVLGHFTEKKGLHGEIVQVYRSCADMSMKEMSELIEDTFRLGAEQGHVWSEDIREG